MLSITIALGFTIILSIIHLLAERFAKNLHKYHEQILSLSAGLFLSFVFLEILEKIAVGYSLGNIYIYLFLLLGFSFFHIINKYIYLHNPDKKIRKQELEKLHFAGFSLDLFFSGLAISLFLEGTDFYLGLIALIPFAFHTISLTFSINELNYKFKTSMIRRIGLTICPILGAISSLIFYSNINLFYYSLAFVSGMVFYLATRHMIPNGTKGRIFWYVLGILIGSLMLIFVS
ncbi:MAG: hypothetical protein WC501_00495 [Candidatus Micrarchaeia archaeon]